jgi:hypothetical protein
MRVEQVVEYLKAIPPFAGGVCFTGGEPMLYYRDILTLLPRARELGLKASLVTGAGWVRREATARVRIKALAEAGLGHICISWDHYHEEFSPRERAVLLARIAIESGLGVAVRVVTVSQAEMEEYHTAFAGLPVFLQSQAPVKVGRADSLPMQHFNFGKNPPSGVCAVVLTPVIEPDGTVYACCGPSHYSAKSSILRLGNTNEEPLENILSRASRDPIFEIILNTGPFGLYQLLKDLSPDLVKTRQAYTGICELCMDITNDPELVNALRERLSTNEMLRFLVASRMWMEKKLMPELRKKQTRMAAIPEEV